MPENSMFRNSLKKDISAKFSTTVHDLTRGFSNLKIVAYSYRDEVCSMSKPEAHTQAYDKLYFFSDARIRAVSLFS